MDVTRSSNQLRYLLCVSYTSDRQPVGRGPIAGLLAKCIGPHNTFCNKVWDASVIFLVGCLSF